MATNPGLGPPRSRNCGGWYHSGGHGRAGPGGAKVGKPVEKQRRFRGLEISGPGPLGVFFEEKRIYSPKDYRNKVLYHHAGQLNQVPHYVETAYAETHVWVRALHKKCLGDRR